MILIAHELRDKADRLRPQPDYRFSSDGCSGGMSWIWRTVFGVPPPWEGCCVVHDWHYWQGGTRADRRDADRELRRCVALCAREYGWGGPVVTMLAWAMWAGVRVFGGPWTAPVLIGFVFTPALLSGHDVIAVGILSFALMSLRYRWGYGWRWPRGYEPE